MEVIAIVFIASFFFVDVVCLSQHEYTCTGARPVKMDYNSFMGNGDETRASVMNHLHSQRMVIVTDVPGVEEVRKRHFRNMRHMPAASHQHGRPFSAGFSEYGPPSFVRSMMSNHYSPSHLDRLEEMRLSPASVSDLSAPPDFPPELADLEKSSGQVHQLLAPLALHLMDLLGMQFNFSVQTSTGRFVTLAEAHRHSEAHKSRSVFVPPQEMGQNSSAIPWHFDLVPLSVHMRDVFMDEQLVEVADAPRESGLQVRTSSGEDLFVRLLPGEVMLQSGSALRAFTGGLCAAQAHRVVAPGGLVGRMSHVLFVQPQFDVPLVSFDGRQHSSSEMKALLSTPPLDRDVIPVTSEMLNHWSPHIPWVVVHQNQMQQFVISGVCSRAVAAGALSRMPVVQLEQVVEAGVLVSLYSADLLHSPQEILQQWKADYLSEDALVALRADRVETIETRDRIFHLSVALRRENMTTPQVELMAAVSVLDSLMELGVEKKRGDNLSSKVRWVYRTLLSSGSLEVTVVRSSVSEGNFYTVAVNLKPEGLVALCPGVEFIASLCSRGDEDWLSDKEWGARLAGRMAHWSSGPSLASVERSWGLSVPCLPLLVSREVLDLQNAETSTQIIHLLERDEAFAFLSAYEGELIRERDQVDGTKLTAGIQIGIARGSLPVEHNNIPYKTIEVLGKTPREVADVVLADVGQEEGGVLVVMSGLSGTGKGTTADLLKEILPTCVTWSNGNIFRSITLLAIAFCEKNGFEFDPVRALTDENIKSFMQMLRFEKLPTGWDVVIDGLGVSSPVGAIQNTDLKAARVAKNVPSVAQQTQGEVIAFARRAIALLQEDGMNVLTEGREQTLNYLPSPHRYTLTLSDPSLVGKRRAAQRIAAATLSEVRGKPDPELGDADGMATRVIVQQAARLAKEAGYTN